jgi:acetamidase/formamidase
MSGIETIAATPRTVKHGFFDATVAPVLHVASGATVILETLSGEIDDLPDDGTLTILPEHREVLEKSERGAGPHLITGPVHVAGATPGDVLQVDILDVALRQNWGWNIIKPLLGTLPEEFPDMRRVHMPIDVAAARVTLPWGTDLPLRPFFGIMAVAPPANWGRITSVIPRAHGGNMDNKELIAGTTLYLPVFNHGVLFCAGDGHGVQGDGEVCLTALETALRGTFRLTIRKDLSFALPRGESADWIMTMAFHEDLDDAAAMALREMISWIVDRRGISREDAYMLCSLACDLRVTQTVDGNKGIHCVLPKAALA